MQPISSDIDHISQDSFGRFLSNLTYIAIFYFFLLVFFYHTLCVFWGQKEFCLVVLSGYASYSFIRLFIYLFLSLSVELSVYLPVWWSISLAIYMLIYLRIYLHLSVCLFVYLCIDLSVCLFCYLPLSILPLHLHIFSSLRLNYLIHLVICSL